MRTESADVLIVGGGPAGASTAFQLARRGISVRVLERSRFPRAKPCAECLSPQASRILHDMGVLSELEPLGAQMRGMIVRAPNGISARGDYAAVDGFRAFRDRGLAIRRELLDDVLLRRARDAGARVDERVRVSDVVRDARGSVRGVRILAPDGSTPELRARIVVGADGLRSVIARRLGLARAAAWPRRIALVAHYRDVLDVSEYVELHVERDGFVGVADVGDGVTSVAAVFPARRARELAEGGGADRSGFLDRWLASKPQLASRFARAIRHGRAAATGPFASHARRAWHPGALLVGDAADFFDPFTGEGIYSALRGGELVADAVERALAAVPESDAVDACRQYDRARREEFGAKWRVERLIGAGVAVPSIVNRAARALADRKHLADLLAGVTGDFVPAREVLRLGYLARLLVLPSSIPNVRTPAWP
jgi:geranylgeranyl reductase family protein